VLNQKGFQRVVALSSAVIWVVGLALIGCQGDRTGEETPQTVAEGFTFFSLGVNTLYSDAVRNKLEHQLGSDAITYNTVINLHIGDASFVRENFPALFQLHQGLNSPLGERVEHNNIKLMYRHARREGVPFDYAEVIFDAPSRKPLLIRVRSERDIASVIADVKQKYGSPRTIDWAPNKSRNMVWENGADLFVISIIPDRYDNPEYHITIFYGDNLQQMLSSEEAQRAKQRDARDKAAKTAF
jgi:hypothetical protein